jgi:hypothetical protein
MSPESGSLTRPSGRKTVPPNKGMRLTRPEHIGALQLIPGVRPAVGSSTRKPPPGVTTARG